jgi:ZIP family zinc transporter
VNGKGIALALLPLALLAVLLAWIVRSGPTEALREGVPPVEILAIPRAVLSPDEILLSVLNDGPDPVTIAQVQVDDAYWSFTQSPAGPLSHLGRAEIRIPYPWVHGETHLVKLVTSTGLTFEHEIAVAVPTPKPSLRFLGLFALIGLYVGVLPVALGLLWYPLAGRLQPRAMDFLLALTLGLLLFLLVDALDEGAEVARELPGTYQGMAILALGVAGAYLTLEALGSRLAARKGSLGTAWVTALLVAVGIGLHNFGEGLAIGAALALGEAALGSLLIVGFTLHNTTEGLAIVAPLARTPVAWPRLLWLGLIGGLPTIAGAWLGGFVYSPVLAVLFLGLGAGAIAQVVVQIARAAAGERPMSGYLVGAPVASGLLAGFLIMYATGMLVQ